MIKYVLNDKFRVKVTDQCNFCCPFCHSEGGKFASDIQIDGAFLKAVLLLRPYYSRVHITGGEPFLYNNLDKLIDVLQSCDYKIALTTNGFFSLEKQLHTIEKLEYINFSVHSFRNDYVTSIVKQNRSIEYVISTITENINSLTSLLPVRINTVVSKDAAAQRVDEVLEFAGNLNLELKLVPEWSVRTEAMKNIRNLLSEKSFNLFEKIYLFPGSNVRERYKNHNGQIVEVKMIELFQPQFLCKDCEKKALCQEGFSFLRLGGNPLYVQPCIFKQKLDTKEFQRKLLPNICDLFREAGKRCSSFV